MNYLSVSVPPCDGGANWSAPIALAKGLQSNSPLAWLGFDANKDVLYVAPMGAQSFRLQRGN